MWIWMSMILLTTAVAGWSVSDYGMRPHTPPGGV